jgi:hypothetical protein
MIEKKTVEKHDFSRHKKMHSFRLTEKASDSLRHLQVLYKCVGSNNLSKTRIVELLIYQEMRRVADEVDEKYLKRLMKEKKKEEKAKQKKKDKKK